MIWVDEDDMYVYFSLNRRTGTISPPLFEEPPRAAMIKIGYEHVKIDDVRRGELFGVKGYFFGDEYFYGRNKKYEIVKFGDYYQVGKIMKKKITYNVFFESKNKIRTRMYYWIYKTTEKDSVYDVMRTESFSLFPLMGYYISNSNGIITVCPLISGCNGYDKMVVYDGKNWKYARIEGREVYVIDGEKKRKVGYLPKPVTEPINGTFSVYGSEVYYYFTKWPILLTIEFDDSGEVESMNVEDVNGKYVYYSKLWAKDVSPEMIVEMFDEGVIE